MKVTRMEQPGKRNLRLAIEWLNGGVGRVGWFPSSQYPDGTPVAGVAAVQEFGTASIPPRLGMRETAATKQGEWKAASKQIANAVVHGKMPPGSLLEAVCLMAEGDARTTITKVTAPPLSLLTLQARMHRKAGNKVTGKTLGKLTRDRDAGPPQITGVSTKPLVDSGYLLATLTSQVDKS